MANQSMLRNAALLTQKTFDLAILGGGILGAGIARDAALRGLSVALVEKADFAGGTSSRSTKLAHGGLRYLEQLAFGLVAESCRERNLLLTMAPHLVQPLSFLLPVYEGDPRSLSTIRLGTSLYDWLTPRRQRVLPPHRTLSAEEAVAEEPALPRAGLRGAVLFYDCQMDDARLCLETILDANRQGAVCLNYCEVQGFRQTHGRIDAAQVLDHVSGDSFDVRAKLFVNAAGPWIERVARWHHGAREEVALSPTKGVHLIIPRVNREHGVYFQSRLDQRMIFLLPWDSMSLLGTTDTDYPQSPDDVLATTADVDYLLGQLRNLVPDHAIDPQSVITSFAGVRALLRSTGRRPSRRSREERIALSGENLLTVAGGKYTTFRAIADKAVCLASDTLSRKRSVCRTAELPLPQHRPDPAGQQLSDSPRVFESDIVHACDAEMAVTLSDVMRRRTRLALSPHGGAATAAQVGRVMTERLGWQESMLERQLREYLTEWNGSRSWIQSPE